jgi:hypothetical protein
VLHDDRPPSLSATVVDWHCGAAEVRLRSEIAKECADRIGRLREQRNRACAHANQAERLLATVITQLLEARHKRYLRNAGVTALPLAELNAVLSTYGLRVRREALW